MKKIDIISLLVYVTIPIQTLHSQDTMIIDKIMYQNKAFSTKDKQIFDANREGSRVWSWTKADKYCKKLKLDGYSEWRVASQKELQSMMSKKPSKGGLYVKSKFHMPATGGKYDNVWMWTRDSKSSKVGGFVDFKEAKSGWADKKYKGFVVCTKIVKKTSTTNTLCSGKSKQELTHGRDWTAAWDTCSGYTALKKDGTLWQFGKVGGCGWGQITTMDPQTGKMPKIKYTYHLKPTKIGDGFRGAKITNGGYRLYAIKRDGTLWGWGEGFGTKPLLLSKSHGWSDFAIKYEGNGCCDYDIGLKKDGTLWRFPESFAYQAKKDETKPKLRKISKYSDWKKIAIGCCTVYGLRKDGSLWMSDHIEEKNVFRRYKLKKLSNGGDSELYPCLKSKMVKVPAGMIYTPMYTKNIEANDDGTLCLLPEVNYR